MSHSKHFLTLVLATSTFLFSTSLFAARGPWISQAEKHKQIEEKIEEAPATEMTEGAFISHLSQYHRKKFREFSADQKRNAILYSLKQQLSPDSAVDQIITNSLQTLPEEPVRR